MVQLSAVDEDTLGEAMTLAWQQAATSKVKGKNPKLKTRKKPTANTKRPV
jgi:hypothetical protein